MATAKAATRQLGPQKSPDPVLVVSSYLADVAAHGERGAYRRVGLIYGRSDEWVRLRIKEWRKRKQVDLVPTTSALTVMSSQSANIANAQPVWRCQTPQTNENTALLVDLLARPVTQHKHADLQRLRQTLAISYAREAEQVARLRTAVGLVAALLPAVAVRLAQLWAQ